MEEIAERLWQEILQLTATSNGNMRRGLLTWRFAGSTNWQRPETVVNGYRVERIYQSSLYGEPYQDFLLIEV